jgi:hypothetical protein
MGQLRNKCVLDIEQYDEGNGPKNWWIFKKLFWLHNLTVAERFYFTFKRIIILSTKWPTFLCIPSKQCILNLFVKLSTGRSGFWTKKTGTSTTKEIQNFAETPLERSKIVFFLSIEMLFWFLCLKKLFLWSKPLNKPFVKAWLRVKAYGILLNFFCASQQEKFLYDTVWKINFFPFLLYDKEVSIMGGILWESSHITWTELPSM